MIVHIPTKKQFNNRLECKKYLGGEAAYNKAQKNGELLFVNVPKSTDLYL